MRNPNDGSFTLRRGRGGLWAALRAVDAEDFHIRFWPALSLSQLSTAYSADGAGDGVMAEIHLSRPKCLAKGWFFPPQGIEIRGLRARIGNVNFVARRKHLRPEVARRHPDRPEAHESGFEVEFHVAPGARIVEFQFKDGEKRWNTFCKCRVKLSRLWWLRRRTQALLPISEYEEWCVAHRDVMALDLAQMRLTAKSWPRRPLISVLMPVFNPELHWLKRAIHSVQNQIYPEWQLCIADDCSNNSEVRSLLRRIAECEPRVRVCFRETNGHICHASNSALEMCDGEFTALLDHDDELPPDALFHVAEEILRHPEAGIIFSDEDKIDEQGLRFGPYFKPGANTELLLAQNVVSHFGVFRTGLLKEVGGFRPGYEGSQDWDITLRVLGRLPRRAVKHIPKVLYHWRSFPYSTAKTMMAKPYALDAGRRAVADYLAQHHPKAVLRDSPEGLWRVEWPLPEVAPLVSIIMPAQGSLDLLEVAVNAVLAQTHYSPFELLLVDDRSSDHDRREALGRMVLDKRVRLIRCEGNVHGARLNNEAAGAAHGEIFVFLSNHIIAHDPAWLRELASQALRADVGAVGGCLLYPDGRVQHAGMVLGMRGVAGHVFHGWQFDANTFGGAPNLAREVTAVTGACLAVRRCHFHAAGGFDAGSFVRHHSDIDFCLRLRSLGLRNLFTPHAKLTYAQPASLREAAKFSELRIETAAEECRLLERWKEEFQRDAFFNPNLSPESEVPVLGRWRTRPE